ncbi:CvpA family protein [Candidatus Uhrbacteria bacterium]|nr:CvpA family protein [Candidatus Uhrbacteria bacterium]
MILVDIVLLLIILSFVGRGWRNGFVEMLGELVGAVIAFIAARFLAPGLGQILVLFMPGRLGLAQFIGFVIVFVLVIRLVGWLFTLADKILKIVTSLPIISSVDKIIGAVLGLLTGIILVGSSVYVVLTLRLDPTLMTWLGGSTIGRLTMSAFTNVLSFLL